MSSSLGELVVHLAANTAEFSDDLGKAAHIADQKMKSIGDAFTKAGIAAQGMAVAAGGAMAVMIHSALESADAMGKQAQSAGLSTEAFSELSYAANLADLSTEEFAASMVKLNRSAVEASKGSMDARVAYKALGIDIRDANGQLKNGEQLLAEVADKFAAFADGPNKSAIAVELFGKSGARMIPMLNEGAEGLRAAREEAKAFGVSIGDEAAKKAEKFNDNLTRLNAIQRGFSQEMAAAVVGPLTDYEQALIDAAKESDIFATAGKAGTVVLQTMSIIGANVAYVFKAVGTEIGGLIAQLSAAGRGDFKGFSAIREEMTKDAEAARTKLDEFEKRILAIGDKAAAANVELGKKAKPPAPDVSLIQAQEKLNDELLALKRDAGYEAYKVELESYTSLQKVRQDSAVESAEYERKKRDAEFEAGQQMYAIEEASFGQLEHLRADWRNQDLAERTKFAEDGLAQIHDTLASEAQIQGEHYADMLASLIEARELGLVTETQYAEKQQELAQWNENALAQIAHDGLIDIEKFRQMSLARQLKTVSGFFAEMTAGVANSNRILFEINKVASISNALLKAQESVVNSYEFGTELGGPVLGAAFAAIAVAATAAQIAGIAGTQFGSGTAPSAANTPAPAVTPVGAEQQQSGQTTIVQLVGGDTFNRKQVRELMDKIVEEQRNGGRVVLA